MPRSFPLSLGRGSGVGLRWYELEDFEKILDLLICCINVLNLALDNHLYITPYFKITTD